MSFPEFVPDFKTFIRSNVIFFQLLFQIFTFLAINVSNSSLGSRFRRFLERILDVSFPVQTHETKKLSSQDAEAVIVDAFFASSVMLLVIPLGRGEFFFCLLEAAC